MSRRRNKQDLARIHELVSRHHQFVYRLAFRLLRHRADAEDVTQGVFLKLLRAPQAMDGVSSERAWLARATLNSAASWIRSEKRRRERERNWLARRLREQHGVREDGGDFMKSNEAISAAISSLPDELRIPVVLYYQEGFKYREIAEACGCPEGTVAQRLSRAKARLREKLGSCGAVAAGTSLDSVLRAESVECPPGLEQSLLRCVDKEFAALGAGSGVTAAAAKLVPPTAVLVKLGAAFVLSAAIVGTAWMAMDRMLAPVGDVAVSAGDRSSDTVSAAASRDVARSRSGDVAAAGPGGPSFGSATSEPEKLAEGATTGATGSGRIAGRVIDARGEPVAGARVALTRGDVNSVLRSVETDADGRYELAVATSGSDASYAFSPQGDSFFYSATETDPVKFWDLTTGAAAATQETVLLTTPVITGSVDRSLSLTEPSEAPSVAGVEGHVVELVTGEHRVDARTGTADAWYSAETSVEYGLKYLSTQRLVSWIHSGASGGHRVIVQADGFEAVVSDEIRLQGEESLELDFELATARMLQGHVLAEGGEPIAGATIRVTACSGDRFLPDGVRRVETDGDGRFEFRSLTIGTFVLRAEAPGFLPVERIAGAGDSKIAFTLPAAGRARVRVLRATTGDALGGFTIELRDGDRVVASGLSDEKGIATIDAVPPGGYDVNAYRSNSRSQFSRARAVIDVRAGGAADVELAVAYLVPVRGYVGWADGRKLPAGLVVTAALDDGIERDGSRQKSAKVGADGVFDLGALPPGGYLLALRDRKGSVIALTELDVVAGQSEMDLDFPIEPQSPGGIEVSVTGGDGTRVPGARVRLVRQVLGMEDVRKAPESGPVRIGVFPGLFDLHITAPGYEPWSLRDIDVVAGQRLPVDVELRRTRRAAGPDDGMDSIGGSEVSVAVQEALGLEVFLELAAELLAAPVAVAPELVESGSLEEIRVSRTGIRSLRDHLQRTLKDHGLTARVRGGTVRIER